MIRGRKVSLHLAEAWEYPLSGCVKPMKKSCDIQWIGNVLKRLVSVYAEEFRCTIENVG